jgi:hypothetical protein
MPCHANMIGTTISTVQISPTSRRSESNTNRSISTPICRFYWLANHYPATIFDHPSIQPANPQDGEVSDSRLRRPIVLLGVGRVRIREQPGTIAASGIGAQGPPGAGHISGGLHDIDAGGNAEELELHHAVLVIHIDPARIFIM